MSGLVMGTDELRAEGFFEIGAFRPDTDKLILFVPRLDAPRPKSVVYAYVDQGWVVYFGQTGGSAKSRNSKLASDTRQKVEQGKPLVGAAWQIFDAVERGRVVTVWSGSALVGATAKEREKRECAYMLKYGTLYSLNPRGWNEFKLPG